MTRRLSTLIRGVEFEFVTPEGKRRIALVVDSYLARRFGCSRSDQDDMLATYDLHRCELEREAVALVDSRPVDVVLIID